MPEQDWEGEQLYIYAMELFSKAGHVAKTQPEFINHSAEQFVYFDNDTEMTLTKTDRSQFKLFNKVSRLFTEKQCAFFSINLLSTKVDRSQAVHGIHTMIHSLIGTRGTVCLFRCNDEILLSFMGFGLRCILSDWYPMNDDSDLLLEKLDIANMCITRSYDYFMDMVYILARDYYLFYESSVYELLPINFIKEAGGDEIDREALDQHVQNQLTASIRTYGDDYVEYDGSFHVRDVNIGTDLDLMLLDLDNEDDNPFGEEMASDEDVFVEDEFYEEEFQDDEHDEYEFDDVDPEIFRDPTLMVKWLNRKEQ